MTSLVLAEHNNAMLSETTARTVSAAMAIGGEIDVLVAGCACTAVADAAAGLAGVRRVLLADDAPYRDRSPEAVAALLVREAGAYTALLAPATAMGKSVMPRVAALLDVMQVSEVIEIVAENTFRRPVYAGNAIETLCSSDAIKVLTVRTTAFAPATGVGSAVIQRIAAGEGFARSRVVSENPGRSDRPGWRRHGWWFQVAGPRQCREPRPCSRPLGEARCCNRRQPSCGRCGYASNDLQVGQTGQVVAPDLYIACGISGAIQHVAGMKVAGGCGHKFRSRRPDLPGRRLRAVVISSPSYPN